MDSGRGCTCERVSAESDRLKIKLGNRPNSKLFSSLADNLPRYFYRLQTARVSTRLAKIQQLIALDRNIRISESSDTCSLL